MRYSLPSGPVAAKSALLLLVVGDLPDVLGALQRHQIGQLAVVPLHDLAVGQGAHHDRAAPGLGQRSDDQRFGLGQHADRATGQLEQLALVARAEQHRAVAQRQAPPRWRCPATPGRSPRLNPART